MQGSRGLKSPWGHFAGTWQKPQKPINLQITTKMMTRGFRVIESTATGNNMNDGDILNKEMSAVSKHSNSSVSHSSECSQSNDVTEKNLSQTSNSQGQTPTVVDSSNHSPSRTESVQTVQSDSRCSNNSTSYNRCTHSSIKEEDVSRPPSSVVSCQSATPRPSSSIMKPMSPQSRVMSNSSSRVSSAPVNSRSVNSSQQNAGSPIALSQSQRTCSRTQSSSRSSRRPESRQKSSQQSVIGDSDGTRVPSSLSYMDSRPSSIGSTTSTKSGMKSRGVQCS